MEIDYRSQALKKILENDRLTNKHFGHVFKGLKSALIQLHSADNLSEISHLPPLRRHKLKGHPNRWSIDLSKNYRLIFDAKDETITEIKEIKEIIIIDIEDNH